MKRSLIIANTVYFSTGIDVIKYAKIAEEKGAGEILLTSMDRDGTKIGYDIELTSLVSKSVSIPLIGLISTP
jgi:cyclase